MIRGFRHKGLKQLYDKGDRRKVLPAYADKIERVLARSIRLLVRRVWTCLAIGFMR